MRTGVLALVLLASGAARGDELNEPTRAPGFVTMLRQDANSRVGADLTYFIFDNESDATLLRFDIHGQYVDPVSGAGFYAQVPIAYLTGAGNSVSGSGDSETAVGGIELGGIYIPKLSTPGLGLVLRAGLTLPNAPDDDAGLVGLFATFMRPIDVYAQFPKSSTLRLGVSPIIRSGQLFARADLGLDINVYTDQGDTLDPGLVVDVGVGVDLGGAAIMGEITTLAVTGDDGDSLTSAALSVRGTGSVQPYGALLIPVDDDVSDVYDLGLLFGVEGRL
jgi:hypothetical protein